VFGLPHERLGEEVVAVICQLAEAELDAQQVQQQLQGKLAKYKIPTKIIIQTEILTRLATGKIAKRQLREGLL